MSDRPLLRWHVEVVEDLKALAAEYGPEVLQEARRLVVSLPGDPLLGDWLENQAGTGDLSACRKVKFGPDEVSQTGVNFGPALRLVCRLLPNNTQIHQVEILAIARRRDLEAYGIAAARLLASPAMHAGTVGPAVPNPSTLTAELKTR